jgi:hypothetical protein
MKVSPIPSGGQAGVDLGNANVGRTASHEKIERAKQIAAGETPISVTPTEAPPQVVKEPSVQKIKMRTQVSPDRLLSDEGFVSEQTEPKAVGSDAISSATDTTEPTPVIEETKPLDPQFAALAKQRRALQARERAIADKEKALEAKANTPPADQALIARLKAAPLSVLQEHGVTYDQLTQDILSNQSNPEIAALKAEIKALKEGVDRTLSEKDQQAEQQVLQAIQREVIQKAAVSDEYEMIRTTRSQNDVKELIHRTFKETGEVLDTEEAMKLVEDELVNEAVKIASTKKLKTKLGSKPTPQQQQPQQTIKTLTNRDTARPIMDRRSRAIAAALGNLKR